MNPPDRDSTALAEQAKPRVSVIIPCLDEADSIRECLDSVMANSFPSERLEVLVVDGGSHDGTKETLLEYADRYSQVRVLQNPQRITPVALNIGIRAACGDVIVRMDAHAKYPPDYIGRCVAALEQYGADNIGGIMVTLPRRDGLMGRAIASALSHRFGVGNSYFRTHPRKPVWVDTVFGGCYRRSVFDRIGMFNELLARGQDMEFNLRLKRVGGRTLLLPEIVSYYYARSDLPSFVRHNFVNGEWAILPFVRSSVMPVTWKHLVPLMFIGALLATTVVGLSGLSPGWWGLLGVAGVYAVATVLASFQVATHKREPRLALVVPFIFLALHLSYGIGSLVGLLRTAAGLFGMWRRQAGSSRPAS